MRAPQSKDNPAPTATEPVLVDWGIVSPLGVGRDAFTDALRSNRLGIVSEDFPGLGPLPVGRVPGDWEPDTERSMAFLADCLSQMQPSLDRLSAFVHPGRRGVCAATSKGQLLGFVQSTEEQRRQRWMEWWANEPALAIARAWDCRGPSQAFVGACATGLTNISRAAEHIEADACDAAIGGSTEATLHPVYLASFRNLGALAITGSYPFDGRHEGFVAAEGAALFLFARRDIAAAAGLRPIARIAGFAAGSDAFHPVGIEATGASIERVGRRAMARAGWNPEDVDWVCAHGTATAGNDRAESAALNRIFAQSCKCPPVVSIKGALGHTMGAAGSVELAACVAALQGQFIPATAGFRSLSPDCSPLEIPREPIGRPWNRVLKLSFGFGGHLVAMAMEGTA